MKDGRVIAIGDVHGEVSKLEKLISKLALTQEDELVFLGDYIDRGEDSKKTLEALLNLRDYHKCTFLMGNHEDMMVDAYRFGSQGMANMWLQNGGSKTLRDFGSDVPEKYLQWAAALPTLYSTQEAHFVHAGLRLCQPAEQSLRSDRLWSRYFLQTDYQWDRRVVCGHTIQQSGQPLVKPNLICIDTGSFLPGLPQTALVIETEEIGGENCTVWSFVQAL
jgi:serine/threonine protein phosphatase 1